jgi:hypothetical protein
VSAASYGQRCVLAPSVAANLAERVNSAAPMLGTCCVFRESAYVLRGLSAPPLSRSATPVASVGIMCLGLVPTLGGPDEPLHWATTAGMVGFGALLLFRHRLRGAEPALARVDGPVARHAGRALLLITAIIAALVGVIVAFQLARRGTIAPLSIVMPSVGLLWLAALGLKSLRYRPTEAEPPPSETERPSRRPPEWKQRSANVTPGRPSPDRHASA